MDLGSEEADEEELTLDVDATIIEAEKGDGERAYDGTVGYHPMLGFLSDGRRSPCCSHVKFRPGNASAQVGIEEAITRTLELVEEQGRTLEYFRSDSAAYQSGVINLLNDENIGYTITADLDEAVRKVIRAVPKGSWQPLEDRDGFKTGREVTERVHSMEDSDHGFRLVIWREQVEDPSLFAETDEDFYRYGAVITNVPEKEMSAEEVLHHHRGRGNAERFIGEAKSRVGLRPLPDLTIGIMSSRSAIQTGHLPDRSLTFSDLHSSIEGRTGAALDPEGIRDFRPRTVTEQTGNRTMFGYRGHLPETAISPYRPCLAPPIRQRKGQRSGRGSAFGPTVVGPQAGPEAVAILFR